MNTLPRISTGARFGATLCSCLIAGVTGCAPNEYDEYAPEPDYVLYEEAYPAGYSYGPGYGYTYYDGGPWWYGGGGGHHYHDWRDDHRTIRNRVPKDADVVAQGQGAQMYQADRDGTVYVRDAKNGKVLYRGRLKEGEKFTLDPAKHRATVDGDVVRREITRKGHENQIYFDPRDGGRRSSSRDGGEARRADAAPRVERDRSSDAGRGDNGRSDGGSRSEGGKSHGGDGGGSGDRRK
jgi:hypothetical protein